CFKKIHRLLSIVDDVNAIAFLSNQKLGQRIGNLYLVINNKYPGGTNRRSRGEQGGGFFVFFGISQSHSFDRAVCAPSLAGKLRKVLPMSASAANLIHA